MAGNKASPSLLIALPICADKGTIPARYMLVTSICGPHPGNKPMMMAIRGISDVYPLNKLCRSILKLNIHISKIKKARITHAVTKFVSEIVSLKNTGILRLDWLPPFNLAGAAHKKTQKMPPINPRYVAGVEIKGFDNNKSIST